MAFYLRWRFLNTCWLGCKRLSVIRTSHAGIYRNQQAHSLILALGCVYFQFTVFVSLSIHVFPKPDGWCVCTALCSRAPRMSTHWVWSGTCGWDLLCVPGVFVASTAIDQVRLCPLDTAGPKHSAWIIKQPVNKTNELNKPALRCYKEQE